MLDISAEAVSDTGFLHLKDARGNLLFDADKNPVGITLYGPSSPAYAIVEGRQTTRAVNRRNEADGKLALATPDQARAETAEDLATITVSFDNFTYPAAGDAKGAALFQALYADPKFGFVIPQVNKFIGNWGNFSVASATA